MKYSNWNSWRILPDGTTEAMNHEVDNRRFVYVRERGQHHIRRTLSHCDVAMGKQISVSEAEAALRALEAEDWLGRGLSHYGTVMGL